MDTLLVALAWVLFLALCLWLIDRVIAYIERRRAGS